MFDKPLFSQRQLKIIIVVTAVAIVLLSASGQRAELPSFQRSTLFSVPVYWLETNSDRQYLSLSFAVPEQLSGDGLSLKLAQQFLLEDLKKTISQAENQPESVNVKSHRDRLQLLVVFAADQKQSPILEKIFTTLTSVISQERWLDASQQKKAQLYLDKQSQKPGWLQLRNWLQPQQEEDDPSFSQWLDFRENLFSQSQLRIAVLSEEAEDLNQHFQTLLPQLPVGSPWPEAVTTLSSPQHQQHTTLDNYQLLLGRQGAGWQDNNFAVEMMAVRQLQSYAQQLGIYTEWQPAGSNSPLILSATSNSLLTPERLLTALQQQADRQSDEELIKARDHLIDQLYERIELESQLHDQLEAIAFYQLSPDYLPAFVQQLETLPVEKLRQQIRDLLEKHQYHWVQFTPAS